MAVEGEGGSTLGVFPPGYVCDDIDGDAPGDVIGPLGPRVRGRVGDIAFRVLAVEIGMVCTCVHSPNRRD